MARCVESPDQHADFTNDVGSDLTRFDLAGAVCGWHLTGDRSRHCGNRGMSVGFVAHSLELHSTVGRWSLPKYCLIGSLSDCGDSSVECKRPLRQLPYDVAQENRVLSINPATGAVVWDAALLPAVPATALPCGDVDPVQVRTLVVFGNPVTARIT